MAIHRGRRSERVALKVRNNCVLALWSAALNMFGCNFWFGICLIVSSPLSPFTHAISFCITFLFCFFTPTLSPTTSPPFAPLQKSSGRGELLLSLCYQSTTNTLTVVVLKARNLPKTENNGPTGTCTLKWTFKGAVHQINAYTNTQVLIVLQERTGSMLWHFFLEGWNICNSPNLVEIFEFSKVYSMQESKYVFLALVHSLEIDFVLCTLHFPLVSHGSRVSGKFGSG